MNDKRDHILDVAEDLFSQHGFEGTSLRVLCLKAGVNVAMISYYFGSKEKLFQGMVERRAGSSLMALKFISARKDSPWKKMEMVIDHYVDKIFSNLGFQRILYRELSLNQRPWIAEALTNIILQNFKEMVSIIEEGQKKKVFRKVDAEMTIASMFGTLSNVTMSSQLSCRMIGALNPKSPITDETHKKRVKKHLTDMFRSHLLINKKGESE
jgi:AcrR family transcriptional regulator